MQNCKATFLGTEPSALEEGHAFKISFLSSFPGAGSRSKPGNSCAVLGPFLLAEVTPLSSFLFGFSRINFTNYRARSSHSMRVRTGRHAAAHPVCGPQSVSPSRPPQGHLPLCPCPRLAPRLAAAPALLSSAVHGSLQTALRQIEIGMSVSELLPVLHNCTGVL